MGEPQIGPMSMASWQRRSCSAAEYPPTPIRVVGLQLEVTTTAMMYSSSDVSSTRAARIRRLLRDALTDIFQKSFDGCMIWPATVACSCPKDARAGPAALELDLEQATVSYATRYLWKSMLQGEWRLTWT